MSSDLPYPPIQPWYAGRSQTATSGNVFHTVDPSTAKPLAAVHTASNADVDAAIESATAAFPAWSATPAIERARILQRAVETLRKRNDDLAKVETHDTGKAYSETTAVDVITGADVLEFFAGLIAGGGLNGETTQLNETTLVYTRKEPLGVCAGIGAWNYPIQIALWKSAPCLAAGNCMIYKPSEFTPLHATRLAQIYSEAGLPPGVFNVVHGDGAVGQYMTSHPSIAKVSFTGQISTGQKVASSASHGMKYVTMELGGKSPLIVLPDADLDVAVDGAMMANFFSTGQVCTNGTRVFVADEIKPEFEKRLLEKMRHIRMGPLMDPKTNFGPLVSETHYKKVQSYIEHGIKVDKATVLYGGKMQIDQFNNLLSKDGELQNGYWCPPYIFTNCTDDMKTVKEEIFGPVMSILPYPTKSFAAEPSPTWPSYLDNLIARANDTPAGLAAGVFTRDLSLAHRVIAKLQAGITWVNNWGLSPAEMSVGGFKMSGLGVENGRKGIEAWVNNKSTLIDLGGKVDSAFVPFGNEESSEPNASQGGSRL